MNPYDDRAPWRLAFGPASIRVFPDANLSLAQEQVDKPHLKRRERSTLTPRRRRHHLKRSTSLLNSPIPTSFLGSLFPYTSRRECVDYLSYRVADRCLDGGGGFFAGDTRACRQMHLQLALLDPIGHPRPRHLPRRPLSLLLHKILVPRILGRCASATPSGRA